MRCSCKHCGTYMIQADDLKLGCVCPECASRCTACLGTNTVLSREDIRSLETLFTDPSYAPGEDEDEEPRLCLEDLRGDDID